MDSSPSLDLIIGPMYSGKSTEILRRLNIFAEMGLRVLFVNSHLDNRSDTVFSTHNRLLGKDINFDMKKIKCVSELIDMVSEYDIIGIDEAQMFQNLKDTVLELIETHKKKILISGLNGDYLRRPFGDIIYLIPLCDTICKLNPFCEMCCRYNKKIVPALFSKRIIQKSGGIIVGGKETYIPVCRKCFHE